MCAQEVGPLPRMLGIQKRYPDLEGNVLYVAAPYDWGNGNLPVAAAVARRPGRMSSSPLSGVLMGSVGLVGVTSTAGSVAMMGTARRKYLSTTRFPARMRAAFVRSRAFHPARKKMIARIIMHPHVISSQANRTRAWSLLLMTAPWDPRAAL